VPLLRRPTVSKQIAELHLSGNACARHWLAAPSMGD
jgi:hypothetical protein